MLRRNFTKSIIFAPFVVKNPQNLMRVTKLCYDLQFSPIDYTKLGGYSVKPLTTNGQKLLLESQNFGNFMAKEFKSLGLVDNYEKVMTALRENEGSIFLKIPTN